VVKDARKKYKALVIVESPAKAKKIGSYLGNEYRVMASVGHVRDLPARAAEIPAKYKGEEWARLGVNTAGEFEPLYVVSPESKPIIKELKEALKDAAELIIATDEDREGESIGWHLVELLEPKVPVHRMVFSEITKDAITQAIQHPRDIDLDLVEAQETRRIVDRLYGYPLSELLWKKVAPKLSAGRVQSVALRLLVERELERQAFHSGTYWDLKADLATEKQERFQAELLTVGGKRVASGKDFDEHTGKLYPDADVLLLDEQQARALVERIQSKPWTVEKVEEREQTRRPYEPFTTSTLQQEANRKLSMTARETMRTAQDLYQNGHITYMRTDSVNLSQECIDAVRRTVKDRYGEAYLHGEVRQYKSKSKNAQEAHEAIRPAGTEMKTAAELGLHGREARLYDLIWKRTVATQMAEARLRFQTVTIAAEDTRFRASGRHVEFPGFFRAYVEGSDDPEAALDDTESALPPMSDGQNLQCEKVEPLAHETKPPARYTEATLVKKLEAEGIGRPSTYASILGTITDPQRNYARKTGSQLVPTFTGIAVTKLLEEHFPNLVDYNFTARMEQDLDDIAAGQADRLPYLQGFYSGEGGLANQVKVKTETIDPREACTLRIDGLEPTVRIGKFGPYLEKESNGEKLTASLPNEIAPADLTPQFAEEQIQRKQEGPKPLGMHPAEGLPVYLKNGPYGWYVQLGEATEENPKPRRKGLLNFQEPDKLTLADAVALLDLPRKIGEHPETGKVVKTDVGMYGPYVLHDKKYGNFDKKTHLFEHEGRQYSVLDVTMDAAVAMLNQSKKRATAEPLRTVGNHPETGEPVQIFEGRYGPYVRHGKKKVFASVPKDRDVGEVTLEEAVQLLEEKAATKKTKRGTKTASTKTAGTKTAARKKPAKKAVKKKG
jgi:DNA topoisomerase-1